MRNQLLVGLGLCTVVSSAAAFEVPRTREEFVKAVAAGKGATKMETLSSDVPLDKLYALLEEKALECLAMQVKRTANVGYVERSTTDYNPTVRLLDEKHAEFTLQVDHRPRGLGAIPPPGGLYYIAADLQSSDAGHTEIQLYRPTIGAKAIVESLKHWLEGEPAPCPELK